MADFNTKPTSMATATDESQETGSGTPKVGPANPLEVLPEVARATGDVVDLRPGASLRSRAGSEPIIDRLPRVRLFGLDFVSCSSVAEVSRRLLEGATCRGDRWPIVVTPNVDILVHLYRNPSSPEAEAFRRAQICLPDGQPLVWASWIIGRRLKARLPGSGLFADLWPRLVAERRPVVVVASSSTVADQLGRQHPTATFVVPPMFDANDLAATDDIVARVIEQARWSRPQFVLIGIGNPKDSRVAMRLLTAWPADLGPRPMVLSLGASFLLYLGHTKRAPHWVQRIGMEWFHRFLQEPRRLFRRYFIKDPAFLAIVWQEWKAGRRGSGPAVNTQKADAGE